MSRSLDLEDFDAEPMPLPEPAMEVPTAPQISEEELEARRVAAYEAGYKCGWDDAERAVEDEGRAITEELGRNLRELGFTYFEARADLVRVLQGFVGELLDRLFPRLLAEAAAANIVAEIGNMAEEICDGRMTLYVSPEDAETVRRLLPEDLDQVLEFVEEPALASGQAGLKATAGEVTIDAERLIAHLRDALAPGATEGEPINE